MQQRPGLVPSQRQSVSLRTRILAGVLAGGLLLAGLYGILQLQSVEICDNQLDDDSDGRIDELDTDCPGYINCTLTYNGTQNNLSLSSSDVFCIPAGLTFSGTINQFPAGAIIYVQSGATFSPATFNNPAGTLINKGSAQFQGLSLSGGFVFDNYGEIRFFQNLNLNGAVSFFNRNGATMTFDQAFSLQNNSTCTNDGTTDFRQDFNIQSNGSMTNNGFVYTDKNFNPGGTFTNNGLVRAKDFININSGSTVINNCRLISEDGFNNNSGNTQNHGLVLVLGATGAPNDLIQNNAAYFQSATGYTVGIRFTNNAAVTGAGNYYFTGETRNQAPFGNDAGGINFYDTAVPAGSRFDIQSTAPHSSVTRVPFTAPDPSYTPATCAATSLTGTDSDQDGVRDADDLDDDNDGIPDALECAGGATTQYAIINGGFEEPVIPPVTYRIMSETNVPGWETTASDGQIEIWSNNFQGIAAYEGTQFAELNANLVAANYQDIITTPGDVLQWAFSHRGRGSATIADVMQVKIGPAGGTSNFSQSYSATNTAWVRNTGYYTVPAGQTLTRFQLEAVSTGSGSISVGNFVDDFFLFSTSSCGLDTDRDGLPNSLDLDSDNDGIPDLAEAGGADADGDGRVDGYAVSTDPGSLGDGDGDGWYNRYDNNSSGLLGFPDADGDGIPNFLDLDSDNDGIPDLIEAGGTDTDGDGRTDDANPDGSLATDADLDGFTDLLDPDDDGIFGVEDGSGPLVKPADNGSDGIADTWPAFDQDGNGATPVTTPDQDGDGYPNFLDLDSDNDGLADLAEIGGLDTNGNGRVDGLTGNAFTAGQDTDNDGFWDTYDPDDNTTSTDENQSGDPRLRTLPTGSVYNGHPGIPDYQGNTSLNNGANADQDQDGIPNYLDLDSDQDGLTDVVETFGYQHDDGGSEARDGRVDGWATTDNNGNGWHNSFEGITLISTDASGTEFSTNTLPDYQTGTGKPDQDGDGLPNYLDIDADADGIVDLIEGQASGTDLNDPLNGLRKPGPTDADYDGLYTSADPTESSGVYIIPVDTDSDAQPDFLDTDADNDGLGDVLEGHDADLNGVADHSPGGTDADRDGLDDAFDANTSSVSALYGNQPVQDLDTNVGAGGNRDWRDAGSSSFPVEWLSFRGNLTAAGAVLDWATATEQNSDYFAIERSADGTRFAAIGRAEAAGNSTEPREYTFTDPDARTASGRLYYRLRQVDVDGTFSYSQVVELALRGGVSGLSFQLFPNPARDNVQLDIAGGRGTYHIRVVTTGGQEVLTQRNQGASAVLNVSSLAAGIYIVTVSDGQDKRSERLVVK
ncbi:MAG: T9SS type A sorting domain-containing protein [Bacteroidia bacterium]|nr:T9SS type A sorting domain-containing protein [Bacteroidia bacterium]